MHESLKKSYVGVLRRDWAALPQAEPATMTPPERFARAKRLLVALFTAAVPALLLFLEPPGLPSWTIYAVLPWAVVSILWSVDPDVDAKLSFFERIVSIINPFARKST